MTQNVLDTMIGLGEADPQAAEKHYQAAMEADRNGDRDGAIAQLREAVAILDRAATRRLYHPHRAARVKGQLTRYVNSLS